MNYIELLNHFWQTQRKVRFSSNEAYLYFFLLQESNIRNWENPFECSNGLICGSIGLSEKTLIDVRNRLQVKGLISFEKGQKRKKSPVYTLLSCKSTRKKAGMPVNITPGNTAGINPNPYINRHKTETIQKQDIRDGKLYTHVFIPPVPEEVAAYFSQEKGLNNTDALYRAERFYNFYGSKNWMVGKNKMSDWRLAAAKSLEWEDNRKNTFIRQQVAGYDITEKLRNTSASYGKTPGTVTREEYERMKEKRNQGTNKIMSNHAPDGVKQ